MQKNPAVDSALSLLRRACAGEGDERVLVIAAHPDDETIGAAALMARLRNPVVVHVTDGAPKDRNFVSAHFDGTLDEYASARRAEVHEALSIAGVPDTSIQTFGVTDLEAAFHLADLARRTAAAIEAARAAVVVTHAYEGGHPDHDAAAFAVHAAAAMIEDPPGVVEMALYHARGEAFTAGEFCSEAGQVLTIHLDADERAMKRRMFDCFATQRDVLAQFTIAAERFREAPQYDFSLPPHSGRLWYEVLRWPLTSQAWREAAAEALRELGLDGTCL